jgi:hypothetical protein
VTKDVLNKPKLNARFDEMGGKAVSKRVYSDVFIDANFSESGFESFLDTASVHGCFGCHYFLGGATLVWEKKLRIPMGFPEFSKDIERVPWKWYKPIFVSLGLPDVNKHFLAVNVGDTQREAFAKTQSHAIDGDEERFVSRYFHLINDSYGFFDGHYIRNAPDLRRLDDTSPLPRFLKRVIPEELQTESIGLNGAPGVSFDKRGEIRFQIILRECVGTAIEVAGDSSDGATIEINGFRSLPL